jgi:hypothetical protein
MMRTGSQVGNSIPAGFPQAANTLCDLWNNFENMMFGEQRRRYCVARFHHVVELC